MSVLFSRLPEGPVAPYDPELLEAGVEALEAALSEEDPARRLTAAALLAAHGRDTGREVLRAAARQDESAYVAFEALRWIDDRDVLPVAREALGRRLLSPFVRAQAAALLATAGEALGEGYLLDRLRNRRRDEDRGLVVELCGELGLASACEALLEIAKDSRDRYRGAACKALALLDPEAIRPALEAMARDPNADADLRCDVVEALARIEDEAARGVLAEVARGQDTAAALAQDLLEP